MRRAFVPENWVSSELSDAAFRTLTVLALHKDRQDHVYVSNDKLASILKKDVRRIQSDLNQAIQLGFIYRKYDEKGRRYFLLTMDKITDDAQRHPMTENDMTENVTPRRATPGGDDAQRQGGMTPSVTSPNNPYIGINLSFQSTITTDATEPISSIEDFSPTDDQNIEPFESGAGPENRSLRIVPRIESQPIEFIPVDLGELKSNFIAVFGPYAEPLTRRIDQAMVDSGFVAWALEECKGKPTPWKLFQHKVKTDWADGAWVSPKQARQEAKRLAEERNKAFLESLS